MFLVFLLYKRKCLRIDLLTINCCLNGVAKTRVRVTPRVRVGVRVRVSKGKGEDEFKDRVKAY